MPRLALRSLLRAGEATWREFYAGAASIVACATFCRDVLAENGVSPDRIVVERQALPGADRTRLLRLPARARGATLRLGLFGRMAWTKGPDLLAKAMGFLERDGLRCQAELVGPVEDPPWFERCVLSSPGIRHLGTLVGDRLADWIASLDLVVLPSRLPETGPLTLLEAWDQCVPAVGTALGGLKESLDDAGLGALCFEPADPAALAAAVGRSVSWSHSGSTVTVRGVTGLEARMRALYEAASRAAA
jgi:glycosyltransferase involved in cell wall biosynthesis